MSNKTTLQATNEDLARILSIVQELPQASKIVYSSEDLTSGSSSLETGYLYFTYDTADIAAGSTNLSEGTLYFVYE